jgi:peptidoglycan/LPS O-acetylase OafA/YrhL
LIVWRGKGRWVVFVIWCGLYVIPGIWHVQQGMTWAEATMPHLYGFPFIVGMLMAGVVLVGWGIFLNRGPARKMIEPQTGRTYMGRPSHSLYHIKMEYWGTAAVLGAILMWVKMR